VSSAIAFRHSAAGATSREPDVVLDREWLYADSMLDWKACPVVERVPDRVSGAWVFKDTRVPVRALFENLEAGATIDDFLQWFPGVTRDQVLAVLAHAERSLTTARRLRGSAAQPMTILFESDTLA
jgi:uncharacterized protein (DUF433 family)